MTATILYILSISAKPNLCQSVKSVVAFPISLDNLHPAAIITSVCTGGGDPTLRVRNKELRQRRKRAEENYKLRMKEEQQQKKKAK